MLLAPQMGYLIWVASLAFVQALPHGVYISMNGNIFNWDNVRKNRQLGFFEKIDSSRA